MKRLLRLHSSVLPCSLLLSTLSCAANCDGSKNHSTTIEKAKFMNFELANEISKSYSTPIFVYDLATIRQQATNALNFPSAYGLCVRFAMKACPNGSILRFLQKLGVAFDASSGYEVERALKYGIAPNLISLSSQELPINFEQLILLGINFNACSLHQLEQFGKSFPGRSCGVRFNPGQGSGGTGKTNVGGPEASFGVWHEYKDQVKLILKKYNIKLTRIHTHIGSGSDPVIWQRVAAMSLGLVAEFPDVTTLNLGGGYKVGRMSYEHSTNLQEVGSPVKAVFEDFYKRTGRQLRLEIEPGTYMVAGAGALLCTVQDITTTRAPGGHSDRGGYTFLKLNSGMTEVLRPSLYGAQHPIVIHRDKSKKENKTQHKQEQQQYVVVGHCCESGDLFTCAPGEPETLHPRVLGDVARIGDLVTIEAVGAYCSSMSTKNYNSFPEAAEVIVDESGAVHLIRRRQSLEQIVQNEVAVDLK